MFKNKSNCLGYNLIQHCAGLEKYVYLPEINLELSVCHLVYITIQLNITVYLMMYYMSSSSVWYLFIW